MTMRKDLDMGLAVTPQPSIAAPMPIRDRLGQMAERHGPAAAAILALAGILLLVHLASDTSLHQGFLLAAALVVAGSIFYLWQGITARDQRLAAREAACLAAAAANQRKSEFLSHMSHELRTPLNAILGFSEVIRDGRMTANDPSKNREYAGDIHYSAQHMLSVVNNILDLAKVESGKWVMVEADMALEELLTATQRLANERAMREQVQLTLDAIPGDVVIYGDQRVLCQALLNLTINAIKFAGTDRQVALAAAHGPDGALEIRVRDGGPGMNAEQIARAMRPFEAPLPDGNGRRKKHDTGLGLPLAAAFIELHGGALIIESEAGTGTTARLCLPADRIRQLKTQAGAVA